MSSSSSSSSSKSLESTWYQKVLLRDVINGQLKDAEPWKIVVGSLLAAGAVAGLRQLKEMHDSPRGLWSALGARAMALARAVPGAEALVQAESAKILGEMDASMTVRDAGDAQLQLPEAPWAHGEVLALLERLAARESGKWRDGKVSGMVYLGDDAHTAFVNRAFCLYSLTNPLHADVFPSLRKLESEVIAMTAHMLGGSVAQGHCGAVTSGGTESILMALKTYRDHARATRGVLAPEVVACETAHAAFNKGCAYFGIRLVSVPVDPHTQRMDVAAAERAITQNTVALVGSAPCFSSGMIDDIPALGRLALRRGVGLHVDGCLGGFVLPWIRLVNPLVPPFDLSVPGVTSMSADTHKYGYAVKGTSVLLFASHALRRHMYFVDTEWPGGVYASPGMAGSRSGGLLAATWASMMGMGRRGYAEIGAGIWATVAAIKEGVPLIPPLRLLGDTQSSVVAIRAEGGLSIFRVAEGMARKGWALNALQRPNAIHLCVCAPHVGRHAAFLDDLRAVVEEIAASPDAHTGGVAGVYGLATSLPDRSIVEGITTGFLDLLTKPVDPTLQPASSSHK